MVIERNIKYTLAFKSTKYVEIIVQLGAVFIFQMTTRHIFLGQYFLTQNELLLFYLLKTSQEQAGLLQIRNQFVQRVVQLYTVKRGKSLLKQQR